MHTFEMLTIDAAFILGFFLGGLCVGIAIMLLMRDPDDKKP